MCPSRGHGFAPARGVSQRLAQSDIAHPVLGRFALRQSIFLFAIRALRDGEVLATSGFLKPMFADHVLTHLQGRRVWQIMVDMYLLERDWDGALAFADSVSGFDREASENLKQRVGQFSSGDTAPAEFRGFVQEYRSWMPSWAVSADKPNHPDDNQILFFQLVDIFVHCNHAELRAGLHDGADLGNFVFADEVAHRRPITSNAPMRPPVLRLRSCCVMTSCNEEDNCERACDCSSAGNTSIMRLMVSAAPDVLPKTRWPVSAAVSASDTVS